MQQSELSSLLEELSEGPAEALPVDMNFHTPAWTVMPQRHSSAQLFRLSALFVILGICPHGSLSYGYLQDTLSSTQQSST